MQKVSVPVVRPGRMAAVVALMPLLLVMASVTEAAPLMQAVHLTLQGDQKPPDPQSTGPDAHLSTVPALDRSSLTQTPASQTAIVSVLPPVMVPPKHTTRPNKPIKTDPATSPAESQGKTWPPSGIPGRRMKMFTVSTVPGAGQKTTSTTTEDQATDGPGPRERGTTENSSLDKQQETSVMTTASVRPGQAAGGAGGRQARGRGATGGPSPGPEVGRREKIMKMLSALEELHRTFNSTLSSRITLMARGNGRSSGKKGKTATAEGAIKTTAAPSTGSSGTAAKTSTVQVDPQSLSGKAFKKSLPPPAKKTNKRVCFWKYCSQN